MIWTRRRVLSVGSGLILPLTHSGCMARRPEAKLLPSRIVLPKPFEAALPILPVLAPSTVDPSADYYDLTVKAAGASILPGATTAIWGYNGIFPAPVIHAWSGRKAVVRLHNGLPAPVVNHLHGGRTPPDSDGYPTDLVLPGETREYVYPNNQRAATLWYHDHRMDFTGAQVWRGLAGLYIIHDDEERRLSLPAGEKEIALVICDRSFDSDGSLLYPSLDPSLRGVAGVTHEYMGGVLGDAILVNGAPWPRVDVTSSQYRLRLLNASNARRYELALETSNGSPAAFIQIGSDGGLLGAPVRHRTLRIAPAERFDVIVDFSGFDAGDTITLVNREGTGTTGQVMRFHVTRRQRDDSAPLPQKLSTLSPPDPSQASLTRTFDFAFQRATGTWTVNGKPFDPRRMDARPKPRFHRR